MDFSFIPKLSPGPRIGSSFMENTTVVKKAKPKIYFSGTLRFLAENRWNALWSISICLPIEEVQNWHIFRTSFLKGFLNPYGQCNLAMIHCVWKWSKKSQKVLIETNSQIRTKLKLRFFKKNRQIKMDICNMLSKRLRFFFLLLIRNCLGHTVVIGINPDWWYKGTIWFVSNLI